MGQYYIAVNVEDMEHVEPHKYGNGAKLMEHSYIGNNFVEAVEFLLLEGGRWHKKPIVWAGEYADEEVFFTLYNTCKGDGLQMLIEAVPEDHYFLVNYDEEEYVDKRKCPKVGFLPGQEAGNDHWQIHPLPILVSEGNGGGGGDYHPTSEEQERFVGSWARCRIGLVKEVPEGFKEIVPNFNE
jgi:hypothetical protein